MHFLRIFCCHGRIVQKVGIQKRVKERLGSGLLNREPLLLFLPSINSHETGLLAALVLLEILIVLTNLIDYLMDWQSGFELVFVNVYII